jgi:hypothetical protein
MACSYSVGRSKFRLSESTVLGKIFGRKTHWVSGDSALRKKEINDVYMLRDILRVVRRR